MRKYKIYGLFCPITFEIKYIGVTIRTLKQREYQHIHVAKLCTKRTTPCAKWIYSLLKNKEKPVMELLEECTQENWQDKERYYINYFKNLGYKLKNIKEGGTGSIIDRHYDGIERSRKAHEKPIYLFDTNCNFFKKFSSRTECAKFLNCSKSAPNKAITNKICLLKGYYVCNQEQYSNYQSTKNIAFIKRYKFVKNKSCKTITIKILDTKEVFTFDTIGDCVNFLNITRGELHRYINDPNWRKNDPIRFIFCI